MTAIEREDINSKYEEILDSDEIKRNIDSYQSFFNSMVSISNSPKKEELETKLSEVFRIIDEEIRKEFKREREFKIDFEKIPAMAAATILMNCESGHFQNFNSDNLALLSLASKLFIQDIKYFSNIFKDERLLSIINKKFKTKPMGERVQICNEVFFDYQNLGCSLEDFFEYESKRIDSMECEEPSLEQLQYIAEQVNSPDTAFETFKNTILGLNKNASELYKESMLKEIFDEITDTKDKQELVDNHERLKRLYLLEGKDIDDPDTSRQLLVSTIAMIKMYENKRHINLKENQILLISRFCSLAMNVKALDEYFDMFCDFELMQSINEKSPFIEDKLMIMELLEDKFYDASLDTREDNSELSDFHRQHSEYINRTSLEEIRGYKESIEIKTEKPIHY